MCPPFKFLLLILAIYRHRSVDCYVSGSLIWSRNLQKFIPVSNVSTFGAYEQEVVAKSREKEKHNFQGKVLKLGYFEDYTMVHFFDNDTKISGVLFKLHNIDILRVSDRLVTTKVNKFYAWGRQQDRELNALDMMYRGKIQIIPRISFSSKYLKQLDFTAPIWETRYRIYIQPERKSNTNWIFNVFERKVWFAVLFLFFLMSALGYAMQSMSMAVSGDNRRRHSLHDHLFYTFATLCAQGFIPDSIDQRSKILGLSKKIFAWLLLISLSSHVISRMTSVKPHPPFEDIQSLLNSTNYTLMSYNGSIAFDHYADTAFEIVKYNYYYDARLRYAYTQEIMYENGCSHEKNYAIFELEDMQKTVGSRFCELVAVGKSYFPTWVTFGVSKDFEYKRTFDIGILKMKEFGLIDRLKNRWLKNPGQTADAKNLGRDAFAPINFNQVLMPFMILSIGIVASAVIFVLELIVFAYKRNQRRPVRGKGLIGKTSLKAHRLPTDYHKDRMRRTIDLSEVSTRPIYVNNVYVVDPNSSHARDIEYAH